MLPHRREGIPWNVRVLSPVSLAFCGPRVSEVAPPAEPGSLGQGQQAVLAGGVLDRVRPDAARRCSRCHWDISGGPPSARSPPVAGQKGSSSYGLVHFPPPPPPPPPPKNPPPPPPPLSRGYVQAALSGSPSQRGRLVCGVGPPKDGEGCFSWAEACGMSPQGCGAGER